MAALAHTKGSNRLSHLNGMHQCGVLPVHKARPKQHTIPTVCRRSWKRSGRPDSPSPASCAQSCAEHGLRRDHAAVAEVCLVLTRFSRCSSTCYSSRYLLLLCRCLICGAIRCLSFEVEIVRLFGAIQPLLGCMIDPTAD